jgi:WhiB family redox-sensing transcriptional regulator
MISPQLHAKTPDLTRGEDWRLRGACRRVDPDLFFVGDAKDNEAHVEYAKWICKGCPVIEQCLAHYLEHPDRYAIAGGLTPVERKSVKRQTYRGSYKHGTTSGFYKHKTDNEPPCEPCKAAVRALKRVQDRNHRAEVRATNVEETQRLLRQGLNEQRIAVRLGVSVRTVSRYKEEW